MDPYTQTDTNDSITREKHFKQSTITFLSSIKLNKPTVTNEYIRSEAEISECKKINSERDDGRKMKERQIRIQKFNHKKNNKNNREYVKKNDIDVNLETKEMELDDINKRKNRNEKHKSITKNSREDYKGKINNKKDSEKENKSKDKGIGKNKTSKYNMKSTSVEKKAGTGFKVGRFKKTNFNKNRRLGKSRRAEIKSRRENK